MRLDIRGICILFFMLSKRLYMQFSYLCLLLVLPLLIFGFSWVAKDEKGILTIALTGDIEVIEELLSTDDTSVLHYLSYTDEASARVAVKKGEVDVAWILPDNIEKAVESFVENKKPIVTLVESGERISYQLARENLYKVLFPYISYKLYTNFMTEWTGKDATDIWQAYYEKQIIEEDFIEFVNINGSGQTPTNYLTSPLRGLMAIWLFICGGVASIMYTEEVRTGKLTSLPLEKHKIFAGVYLGSVVFNAGLAFGLCITFLEDRKTLLAECVGSVILILSIVVFFGFFLMVARKGVYIAFALPPLVLVLLTISPIFLNLDFGVIEFLSPLYYYFQVLYFF